MPHSFGYRSRTRHLFARPFRAKGQLNMTNYLTSFNVGDFVDIRANGAIHKGMPYKYYHGRTGKVWNVTPRAIGVMVNKKVRYNVKFYTNF
jgi:large subunit ribosomal protein L21e